MKPFLSSGPVVGSKASGLQPAPHNTMPFSSSGTVVGSEASHIRSILQSRFNDPSVLSCQTSNIPPTDGPFQHYPTPHYHSTVQVPLSHTPNMVQQAIQPPVGQVSSLPASLLPQVQIPSVPKGSPPQCINHVLTNIDVPQSSSDSLFADSRPLQLHFPGYVSKQSIEVSQVPPIQSPFLVHRESCAPAPAAPSSTFLAHQGGYVPPLQVAASLGLQSMEEMQYPGSRATTGATEGLMEDVNALFIGSFPGSVDPGFDPKELPRPLDSDKEPKLPSEKYPMNCNPRYLQLTTSVIPNSQSLASRWHLPLGAVVCPLAEAPVGEEVPIVHFASTGIIRCRSCCTYVNPYVTFTDVGRKWQCNICSLLNDVPGDYFAHLDTTGRRVDLDQRPELTKGSVEFVAPVEYMVRPPMRPLYFFLIDVSISAVRSGMVEVVAHTIRSSLDKLPGFPRTQIGFITFDSTIHFYNMKSSLTHPQMMVISDLDDVFVPFPDDLIVNLSESRSTVESFLDGLSSMFQGNMNEESAFGPALKAAFMVMRQVGGKLLIFQNTLPSLGLGRLKLREEDPRVYGMDKEHVLRQPKDPFYKKMAADFNKFRIGVNVYAFSDKYIDIASLGTLAKYTGGQVYYYSSFSAVVHGEKLKHELARDLTRETAWEAVMRIRCGKGIRFTSFHGNLMLRSSDLLGLPALDCDKAFVTQLSLEEKSLTTETVYFQVSLLYTTSCGQRRIRLHTAAAPVVTDLGEMYRQADAGAIISLFCRLAIERTLSQKLEDARKLVKLRVVKALREYRRLYAVKHHLGGRMIYPESLKFLPLYALALCKSTPLRGGHASPLLDERCAASYTMTTLPVKNLLKLLYPTLIRAEEYLLKESALTDNFKNIDKRLPLASESLDSTGLYIYDDGFRFVIWFGKMLSPDIAMNLLGADFAAELSKVTLCEHDNEMSRKLMALLKKFRENDPSYYQLCQLVRQGEQPREGFLLLANLVEDPLGGIDGYLGLISQIHQQVQLHS